ncbi:MAG TPA: hypothetical protein VGI81_04110 [Tepidisphaeraceae bacterium]|jgi:hypothetical protein
MILVCNGRTYSTAELRAFRTNDPALPYIYLTPDGRSTFIVERDPDGTVTAHRAATGEIITLSRRYKLEALLGAFPAVYAHVEVLPGGLDEGEETIAGAILNDGGAFAPPGARG